MPKKYKPFDVLKDTGALMRLRQATPISYGPVGPPFDFLKIEDKVAWVDLVEAVAPGLLQQSDRQFLELAAGLLRTVREGKPKKTKVRLLGKCLRQMGLTPASDATPEQQQRKVLAAFKSKGPVN